MKPNPYKYDFKYRVEPSGIPGYWCVKQRNFFGIWSIVINGLENEKAAYMQIEVLETKNK
jgi:hypothetical protein